MSRDGSSTRRPSLCVILDRFVFSVMFKVRGPGVLGVKVNATVAYPASTCIESEIPPVPSILSRVGSVAKYSPRSLCWRFGFIERGTVHLWKPGAEGEGRNTILASFIASMACGGKPSPTTTSMGPMPLRSCQDDRDSTSFKRGDRICGALYILARGYSSIKLSRTFGLKFFVRRMITELCTLNDHGRKNMPARPRVASKTANTLKALILRPVYSFQKITPAARKRSNSETGVEMTGSNVIHSVIFRRNFSRTMNQLGAISIFGKRSVPGLLAGYFPATHLFSLSELRTAMNQPIL